MENNELATINNRPVTTENSTGRESELAVQFLDILNFTGLMESQTAQSVIGFLRRLGGSQQELEYVMAISG